MQAKGKVESTEATLLAQLQERYNFLKKDNDSLQFKINTMNNQMKDLVSGITAHCHTSHGHILNAEGLTQDCCLSNLSGYVQFKESELAKKTVLMQEVGGDVPHSDRSHMNRCAYRALSSWTNRLTSGRGAWSGSRRWSRSWLKPARSSARSA